MSILLGTTKIKELKLGETDVQRAYMGETLVYEKTDPRGWWVHKTTGVKTYFDMTEPFIVNNEYFTKPPWIQNAKEVKIPYGVLTLEQDCFKSTYLNTIILSDSVTTIGSRCFTYNSYLTNVTIPSSVTNTGYWSFGQSNNCRTIYTDIGNSTRLRGLLAGSSLPAGYVIIEQ